MKTWWPQGHGLCWETLHQRLIGARLWLQSCHRRMGHKINRLSKHPRSYHRRMGHKISRLSNHPRSYRRRMGCKKRETSPSGLLVVSVRCQDGLKAYGRVRV